MRRSIARLAAPGVVMVANSPRRRSALRIGCRPDRTVRVIPNGRAALPTEGDEVTLEMARAFDARTSPDWFTIGSVMRLTTTSARFPGSTPPPRAGVGAAPGRAPFRRRRRAVAAEGDPTRRGSRHRRPGALSPGAPPTSAIGSRGWTRSCSPRRPAERAYRGAVRRHPCGDDATWRRCRDPRSARLRHAPEERRRRRSEVVADAPHLGAARRQSGRRWRSASASGRSSVFSIERMLELDHGRLSRLRGARLRGRAVFAPSSCCHLAARHPPEHLDAGDRHRPRSTPTPRSRSLASPARSSGSCRDGRRSKRLPRKTTSIVLSVGPARSARNPAIRRVAGRLFSCSEPRP